MPASVATEGAQSGTVAASATPSFQPYGSSTSVSVDDEIVIAIRIGNITTTVTSFSDGISGSQNVWYEKILRFAAPSGFSIAMRTCKIVTSGILNIALNLSSSVSIRWSTAAYLNMSDLSDAQNHGSGSGATTFDSGPLTTVSGSDTVIGFGGGNTATSITIAGTGVTFSLRTASNGMCCIADAFGVPRGTTADFKPTVGSAQTWAVGIISMVDEDQADALSPLPQPWIQRKVNRAVLAR